MRPDPSDIIIKKRLQHSRNKTDYGNALAKITSSIRIYFSLFYSFSCFFEFR